MFIILFSYIFLYLFFFLPQKSSQSRDKNNNITNSTGNNKKRAALRLCGRQNVSTSNACFAQYERDFPDSLFLVTVF